jgi:hypothetical protein
MNAGSASGGLPRSESRKRRGPDVLLVGGAACWRAEPGPASVNDAASIQAAILPQRAMAGACREVVEGMV